MSAHTAADGKILIIGPSWVGDMVLAQSLFKVLKERNPDIVIDVAAPAWTLPLLKRMPEVNDAIPLPFAHGKLDLGKRISIGLSLRERDYAQAILLTNSLKSAIVPFTAGIPLRTGFLGEFRYGLLNDIRPLDKIKLPRTVDRFVALGLNVNETLPPSLPEPRLIADSLRTDTVLTRLGLERPSTPVIALCPGAEYGEAKRWPKHHYAELALNALNRGWQVWLFGSQKDANITVAINALTQGRCTDLGGKTDLGEAIDLMNLASVIVSNDSGLMHIGAALNKPLIAIYGSSDPAHTPPMSRQAVIHYLDLVCSPCFARNCPLGHQNCLNHISPAQVASSIWTDKYIIQRHE